MRLLIVSDLHIGTSARTKELCPYPTGSYKDITLVDSFIKYVLDYQVRKGPIDFLIIPGDITNKSNLVEYRVATEWINKVTKALKIKRDRIIFVPGNHDVDWSIITGIPPEEIPFRKEHRYNTLLDKQHAFSALCTDKLVKEPYIRVWEYEDVVFYGYNSCTDDDGTNQQHYGVVHSKHLSKLRELFERLPANKLKFFVVHHHLYQFDNPHPEWRDFSTMQNAQQLLELLSEFEFNFVIHGHRHVPKFITTTISSFKPINILCAGSYSCEMHSMIAGFISNTFHIVELDDKIACKGRLLSLAFDERYGWVDCKSAQGIEFESPFGIQFRYEDILAACVKEVKDAFKTNHYILYKSLETKIEDLVYFPNNLRQTLFKEIENHADAVITTRHGEHIIIKR